MKPVLIFLVLVLYLAPAVAGGEVKDISGGVDRKEIDIKTVSDSDLVYEMMLPKGPMFSNGPFLSEVNRRIEQRPGLLNDNKAFKSMWLEHYGIEDLGVTIRSLKGAVIVTAGPSSMEFPLGIDKLKGAKAFDDGRIVLKEGTELRNGKIGIKDGKVQVVGGKVFLKGKDSPIERLAEAELFFGKNKVRYVGEFEFQLKDSGLHFSKVGFVDYPDGKSFFVKPTIYAPSTTSGILFFSTYWPTLFEEGYWELGGAIKEMKSGLEIERQEVAGQQVLFFPNGGSCLPETTCIIQEKDRLKIQSDSKSLSALDAKPVVKITDSKGSLKHLEVISAKEGQQPVAIYERGDQRYMFTRREGLVMNRFDPIGDFEISYEYSRSGNRNIETLKGNALSVCKNGDCRQDAVRLGFQEARVTEAQLENLHDLLARPKDVRAAIFAVSHKTDESLNRVSSWIENDANNMALLLKDSKELKRFEGYDLTRGKILSSIEDFVAKGDSNDVNVVFIGTHGMPDPTEGLFSSSRVKQMDAFLKDEPRFYLFTSESNFQDPNTLIIGKDLANSLGKKSFVLILGSCFSGGVADECMKAIPPTASPEVRRSIAIAATSQKHFAYQDRFSRILKEYAKKYPSDLGTLMKKNLRSIQQSVIDQSLSSGDGPQVPVIISVPSVP